MLCAGMDGGGVNITGVVVIHNEEVHVTTSEHDWDGSFLIAVNLDGDRFARGVLST